MAHAIKGGLTRSAYWTGIMDKNGQKKISVMVAVDEPMKSRAHNMSGFLRRVSARDSEAFQESFDVMKGG
jgi:hypothetical protein